jgi:hypothetical protein
MLVTVTRTSNRDTRILAAPFPGERMHIPPWVRRLMNCHRSQTEVNHRIASILHQHGEEESGSKG